MALLKQCFCYSLRQGSFIIGSYSLIVYCAAFAVELWWIIESLLILPAPAYTLCALYFFNFIIAAILLFGLLVRQRKYLMTYTLMTVLSFFPEAGMVLFMSLYYWPAHKYEYGVIELGYWSFRAIFNIFGAFCVCSLYLHWRDEEMILGRLHDLTLANMEGGNANGVGVQMIRSSNGTVKHSSNLAYQNYAFSRGSLHDLNNLKNSTVDRSSNFSMGPSRSSMIASNKSEFSPTMMFDRSFRNKFGGSRVSEMGIAGIGLDSTSVGIPGGLPGSGLTRSRSLWNVSGDEYWSRAPPTRPVSMGYVNHIQEPPWREQSLIGNGKNYFDHQYPAMSLDRRRGWIQMRRAQSMDGLNHFYRYYGQNIMASQNNPNWSKSSLGQESDDRNYRDIAL